MSKITIEVVYATPQKQYLWQGIVAAGTGARQAVLQSTLPHIFIDIDFQNAPIGVCGQLVNDDFGVEAWDRIEIYRPLLIDPKENRRRRALKNNEQE